MLSVDCSIADQQPVVNQHSAFSIFEEVLSHTTEARAGTTGRE